MTVRMRLCLVCDSPIRPKLKSTGNVAWERSQVPLLLNNSILYTCKVTEAYGYLRLETKNDNVKFIKHHQIYSLLNSGAAAPSSGHVPLHPLTWPWHLSKITSGHWLLIWLSEIGGAGLHWPTACLLALAPPLSPPFQCTYPFVRKPFIHFYALPFFALFSFIQRLFSLFSLKQALFWFAGWGATFSVNIW